MNNTEVKIKLETGWRLPQPPHDSENMWVWNANSFLKTLTIFSLRYVVCYEDMNWWRNAGGRMHHVGHLSPTLSGFWKELEVISSWKIELYKLLKLFSLYNLGTEPHNFQMQLETTWSFVCRKRTELFEKGNCQILFLFLGFTQRATLKKWLPEEKLLFWRIFWILEYFSTWFLFKLNECFGKATLAEKFSLSGIKSVHVSFSIWLLDAHESVCKCLLDRFSWKTNFVCVRKCTFVFWGVSTDLCKLLSSAFQSDSRQNLCPWVWFAGLFRNLFVSQFGQGMCKPVRIRAWVLCIGCGHRLGCTGTTPLFTGTDLGRKRSQNSGGRCTSFLWNTSPSTCSNTSDVETRNTFLCTFVTHEHTLHGSSQSSD